MCKLRTARVRGTCERWHERTTYQKLTTPTANLAPPSAGTLQRWFLVTNAFKTVLVAISLFVRDPQSQGVAALVIVLMMLAATLLIMPYQKRDSNMLEATLFVVVR